MELVDICRYTDIRPTTKQDCIETLLLLSLSSLHHFFNKELLNIYRRLNSMLEIMTVSGRKAGKLVLIHGREQAVLSVGWQEQK